MAELVLNSGESGNLKDGWTLALIYSLELNSLEEIAAAVRLGQFSTFKCSCLYFFLSFPLNLLLELCEVNLLKLISLVCKLLKAFIFIYDVTMLLSMKLAKIL